mmetsp:Transcript_28815/g.56466  ORF Transcript_28815/g.56466 Transcript_28815/m.56466 type:complete len:88 (-) Transcript_28815:1060-1323(-)
MLRCVHSFPPSPLPVARKLNQPASLLCTRSPPIIPSRPLNILIDRLMIDRFPLMLLLPRHTTSHQGKNEGKGVFLFLCGLLKNRNEE